MKRTKEQITKFWEWCGWKVERSKGAIQIDWYRKPDGDLCCGFPVLSLDTIFKYAIPKLQENGDIIEFTTLECNSFDCRVGNVIDGSWNRGVSSDNPIEALFDAIYEVIENE